MNSCKNHYRTASARRFFECVEPKARSDEAEWYQKLRDSIRRVCTIRAASTGQKLDHSENPVYRMHVGSLCRSYAIKGTTEVLLLLTSCPPPSPPLPSPPFVRCRCAENCGGHGEGLYKNETIKYLQMYVLCSNICIFYIYNRAERAAVLTPSLPPPRGLRRKTFSQYH